MQFLGLITEKRVLTIPAQTFVGDGQKNGQILVPDTSLFRVGILVDVKSDTQEFKRFKINRILGKRVIFLGPEKSKIQERSDLSAFSVADNATIEAIEQNRPSVPEQEVERITYEEEPIVARRVFPVDNYGGYAGSPESKVNENEPDAKFYYGPAMECIRIMEYAPESEPGDLLAETFIDYDFAYNVTKIWKRHREAVAGDLT